MSGEYGRTPQLRQQIQPRVLDNRREAMAALWRKVMVGHITLPQAESTWHGLPR